jgi:hypothetical protein
MIEDEGATEVTADHKTGIISFNNLEEKRAVQIIRSEGYEVLR